MGAPFAFIDSPLTMLILGAVAVLLFGERLPEVARSIGKGLMELKAGVHSLQREIEDAVNTAGSPSTHADAPHRYTEPEHREEATAPKFEPPPSDPS